MSIFLRVESHRLNLYEKTCNGNAPYETHHWVAQAV